MRIEEVFDTVREDLEAVEGVLHEEAAQARVGLLSRVGDHILSGGGKRFRPTLTLLSGRLCGTEAARRIPLAASVELIHNATLLHDDIVDEAAIRRGRPSAHLIWGDTAGVVTANFHFSRAFTLILQAGGIACLRVVNRTLNAIVEGELLQFLRVGFEAMDEPLYRQIILRKTARLIATACHIGALPGQGSEQSDRLARFGLELGMAFQMADDLLDYNAEEATLGKKVGTDFREGKYTLPLITALSRCTTREREDLLHLLRGTPAQREESFPWARDLIERYDGFSYTHAAARDHVRGAIRQVSGLRASREQDALVHLAHFVVRRTY